MSEMHSPPEAPDNKPDNRLNGADNAQNNPQVLNGKAHSAGDAPVSRQVYRQAECDNEKHKERPEWFYQADWPSWWKRRGPDGKRIFKNLHPIIPFGAPTTRPELGGGKVVGQKGPNGQFCGKKDWTTTDNSEGSGKGVARRVCVSCARHRFNRAR
jgi:hypothetical protein